MPALPLHEAGKYVVAAYLVVLALIIIYVAIMATRLRGIEREVGELNELLDRHERGRGEALAVADEERELASSAATGRLASSPTGTLASSGSGADRA